MSGRKQHYIPQFLLNGFSAEGRGKKRQVRVVTRDKTFIAATDGVAAEREFYSELVDDVQTLDDVITDAENEYSNIYQNLANQGAGTDADPIAVARLVCHLSVRGNHLRSSISAGGRYVMAKVLEAFSDPEKSRMIFGISGTEPSAKLRAKLDEIYDERKTDFQQVKMSRHDFRRIAFKYAQDNWEENLSTILPSYTTAMAQTDISQIMYETHNKTLSESLEPEARVEALSSLKWSVIDAGHTPLIMPDCIAIAHSEGVGTTPVGFVGKDDLMGAIFPLTTNKAVCSGLYNDPQFLEVLLPKFSTFAAANSWNFVIMNPERTFETDLGSLIGHNFVMMITKIMQEVIQDAILEGATM